MVAAAGSSPAARPSGPPTRPGWPARLLEACRSLRSPGAPAAREHGLSVAWDLLNTLSLQYLHRHETKLGRVDPEDCRDIASEKSLEILRAVESGKWDIASRSGGEIAAYVSTVARNGLVDRLRELGRLDYSVDDEERPEPVPDPGRVPMSAIRQDTMVQTSEFVEALTACARELQPRNRRLWFYRVFFDMPSKDIARHPRVQLKLSHVDVLLKRNRESIRECMRKKGHRPHDMPPGTFTELWFAFGDEIQNPGEPG